MSHTGAVAGAVFDRLAPTYDQLFTGSHIGRAQRSAVWQHMLKTFHPGDHLLELNCGTGEDALFLASHGISVLACDASQQMIRFAQTRLENTPQPNTAFRHLATEDIATLAPTQFDGAFSNFSGLNCVQDLTGVASSLSALVKSGGSLLFCFSTRICLTEIAFYLLRGQTAKAFRRTRGSSQAVLDGTSLNVFYPTVNEIRQAFAPHFRLRSTTGIGIVIPPSYLEPWARRHPHAFRLLCHLERPLSIVPLLRTSGDHVLLRFEKVTP